MKFKYIRTRSGFIIFAPTFKHSEIASGIDEKIDSAGFCNIGVNHMDRDNPFWANCHGESTSLKLTSGDGDSDALTRQLNRSF